MSQFLLQPCFELNNETENNKRKYYKQSILLAVIFHPPPSIFHQIQMPQCTSSHQMMRRNPSLKTYHRFHKVCRQPTCSAIILLRTHTIQQNLIGLQRSMLQTTDYNINQIKEPMSQAKSFTLINEETAQTLKLSSDVTIRRSQICILPVINTFNEMKPCIKKRLFSVCHQARGNDRCILTAPYLLDSSYGRISEIRLYYHEESDMQESDQEAGLHRERNKERTIRDVICSVKKWRKSYEQPKGKQKLTLSDAAELVGLSKKSLDDYFCQLRLGQKYGFDFSKHIDDGIGILRTFVRENREKEPKKQGNERHPRTLKILDQFDSDSECFVLRQQMTNTCPPSVQCQPLKRIEQCQPVHTYLVASQQQSTLCGYPQAQEAADPAKCLSMTQFPERSIDKARSFHRISREDGQSDPPTYSFGLDLAADYLLTPMDRLNQAELQNQFFHDVRMIDIEEQNVFGSRLTKAEQNDYLCVDQETLEHYEQLQVVME